MTDLQMFTQLTCPELAAAFPFEHQAIASSAAEAAVRMLADKQWTERFAVTVNGQQILIPARLRFATDHSALTEKDAPWIFVRALQTRSFDGYERQRVARDLLANFPAWGAPFIVALIGEYIVEILADVAAAMTPEIEHTLGTFIANNIPYWETTKRRVASYWNLYYRDTASSDCRTAFTRREYVGFQLVDRLDAAARQCRQRGAD
jgi:hypothetical protein